MKGAWYNEIDLEACGALRELMAMDLIMDGDIDSRSIKDVRPDDLRGYTQVHFFAGIGVWSYSARLAGWPDDLPIWSMSCPCQPFSAAGKGGGADDPRHLWPDAFRLVRAGRPALIVGEQVAGSLGYGWFDGVRSDLASENYASRAVDIPACSIDAPHIRNRLAWIAKNLGHADREGWTRARVSEGRRADMPDAFWPDGPHKTTSGGEFAMGDPKKQRCGPGLCETRSQRHGVEPSNTIGTDGIALGHAISAGLERHAGHGETERRSIATGSITAPDERGRNGTFWSDAEWLLCHDNKARRAQPGIRLLVDGAPARIPRWRVAGNSICAPLFKEVLAAVLETEALVT
jgi:DNA (cytosine-5)-methyltransferase 1